MNPLARIALFAAALLAIFGGGVALGAAVDPTDPTPPPTHVEHTT